MFLHSDSSYLVNYLTRYILSLSYVLIFYYNALSDRTHLFYDFIAICLIVKRTKLEIRRYDTYISSTL